MHGLLADSNADTFTEGFERLIHTLKSLLLSVALINRHLTVEEAVSLSRLEQEYQVCQQIEMTFSLYFCDKSFF